MANKLVMRYPIWNYIDDKKLGYGVPREDRCGGIEKLRRYKDGGLCPVLIGQQLCGLDIAHCRAFPEEVSYKVVTKLGYGSFATVWLARDQ